MPKISAKLSRFGAYLKKQKISHADAAAELGVTRSYIQALATGVMTPGLKLAVEIQRWTKNAIEAAAWIRA